MVGFYAALDSQRASRKLTWKEVAAESGVSASTFTRISQGRSLNIDGLALLLAWSGLDATSFLKTRSARPETLAQITVHLRADRNLNPKSAEALEEIIRVAYHRFQES